VITLAEAVEVAHDVAQMKTRSHVQAAAQLAGFVLALSADLADEAFEQKGIHEQLHALWTAAVGTPGYDKSKWRAFEEALLRLTHTRPVHAPPLPFPPEEPTS